MSDDGALVKVCATFTAGDLRISLMSKGVDKGSNISGFVSGDNLLIEENEPDAMGADSWRAIALDFQGRVAWRNAFRKIFVRLLKEKADAFKGGAVMVQPYTKDGDQLCRRWTR